MMRRFVFSFTVLNLLVIVFMLVVFGLTPVAAHDEDPQAHKDIIQRLADDALSMGDPSVLDEIFAADYQGYLPPSFSPKPASIDAYKFLITSVKGAMPDFKANLEIAIAEGDWAAYRLVWTGTFTEPLMTTGPEVPPTGNPVVLPFNIISRFNGDDQIAEEWVEFDNLSWLTQIGAIPMPEGAAQEPMEYVMPELTIMETTPEMMETNKAGVATINDEGFNKGDVSVVDDLFLPDFVNRTDGTDREAFKQTILALRAAFPDLMATSEMVVAEGNWVAFRFTANGTFENDFVSPQGTLPPTGKPLMVTNNILIHLDEDGHVIEFWEAYDNLGFLTQLGAILAPGA
jgi:predicted ester cyclase